jgi:hypothetical protein
LFLTKLLAAITMIFVIIIMIIFIVVVLANNVVILGTTTTTTIGVFGSQKVGGTHAHSNRVGGVLQSLDETLKGWSFPHHIAFF